MSVREVLLSIDLGELEDARAEAAEKWDEGTRADRKNLREAVDHRFPALGMLIDQGIADARGRHEGVIADEAATEAQRALVISGYAITKAIEAQEAAENGFPER